MSMELAIRTENLEKTYGEAAALSGLNLSVKKGEIYGFLGPNGAGKTTTMRILTGLLLPTSGSASVAGVSIENPDELTRKIGYAPSDPPLYDELTGREQLEYAVRLRDIPVSDVQERITRLLKRFNLEDASDDRVGSYSKGMKQKINVIQAILHQPEVLLLDEPTSGLDPQSAREMRNLIQDVSIDGRTVVLSTHILSVVDEIAETVGVLMDGRLVAEKTPTELKQTTTGSDDASLEEAFIDLTT